MTITIKDLKQRAKENGYIAFESDESLLFLGRASTNEENKIILNKKDNSILEYNVTFSGYRDFDMLAAVKEYVASFKSDEQDEKIEEKGEQLTYKELKKIAKKNGYRISDDGVTLSLIRENCVSKNEIDISKVCVNRIWIRNGSYVRNSDVSVMEAAVKCAKTSLEDREGEKRYIVPLPGLTTTDGEQQYLTHKKGHWFACRRKQELRQTWKEEHLCYVPDQYRGYAVEVDE